MKKIEIKENQKLKKRIKAIQKNKWKRLLYF